MCFWSNRASPPARDRAAHPGVRQVEAHRFAVDSPLEGTGFEPSVPRDTTNLSSRLWLVPANRKVAAKENRHTKRRALPPRNRWFESCSLQRRVCLSPGAAVEGREPRLSARLCAAG